MKDAHIKNCRFYKRKKVLVTGHTGFKGAWLTVILDYMEAEAVGYSLAPSDGCLYEQIKGDGLINSVEGDLLDYELLRKTILDYKPEIVIHLAAFGFMKECFEEPTKAYKTNLLGTLNLLEILRECPSVKSIVLISTDKVYENKGDGANYKEEDALGGQDPYSCSKVCMEFLARDYCKSYFQANGKMVGLATVRASNVLAGGDHIQTRLIPTILRSIANGIPVELRNPLQTRPWQSVLDALNGYLTIARYLYDNPTEYSGNWNIGPTRDGIRTVSWVFERMKERFSGLEGKKGEKFLVSESETLGLDIGKALKRLDWEPRLSCEKTIDLVVDFFKGQQAGYNVYEICKKQVSDFYGGKYE